MGVGGSGSVGGDDDLAEGAPAEGVEGGLHAWSSGTTCWTVTVACRWPGRWPTRSSISRVGLAYTGTTVAVWEGTLVRALHEGGEEPAAVTDQFDNARVPGEVGENVNPVRCYRADLGESGHRCGRLLLGRRAG